LGWNWSKIGGSVCTWHQEAFWSNGSQVDEADTYLFTPGVLPVCTSYLFYRCLNKVLLVDHKAGESSLKITLKDESKP